MASSNRKIGPKLIACWTISTSTCPFEADRCRFTNMQHSRFGWGQIRTWIFSFLTLQTCMEVGPTRVNPIQDTNRGNLRIHFSLCWNKLTQHLTKSNAVLFFLVFGSIRMVLNSENWGWRERTLIEGCHANRTANMLCVSPSPYRWEPRSKNVRRFYSVKVCVSCGFVMTLPQTWKILIMVDLKLQRKTNQTCDPIHKQLRLKQLGFEVLIWGPFGCCICAWSQIVFSNGIWSHTLQYYIHKILCIAGRKSNFQSSISSSSQSLRLKISDSKSANKNENISLRLCFSHIYWGSKRFEQGNFDCCLPEVMIQQQFYLARI